MTEFQDLNEDNLTYITDELDNENNIVLDVRPNPRLPSPQIAKKCHKGRRTVCTTKYHTGTFINFVKAKNQENMKSFGNLVIKVKKI